MPASLTVTPRLAESPTPNPAHSVVGPRPSAPQVLVLGAGMVGVCTALHLQARGVQVALIDRRPPGEETSHGNAGLIQQEAVAPYPFPFDAALLWAAAKRRSFHIHWHPSAVAAMLPRLARYAWHSRPGRHARITEAYSRLVAHATAEHQPWVEAAGAQALITRRGFRFGFRQGREWTQAVQEAEHTRHRYGVPFEVLDAAALQRAEPALSPLLVGALHWTSPWSVSDPGELVKRYADLFVRRGGQWWLGDAHTLQPHRGGWCVRVAASTPVGSSVRWDPAAPTHDLEAAQAVVALGPWSGPLARRLHVPLPMFIKRGYHQHFASDPSRPGLNLPLLDVERGYVLAPMQRGVRLTTGAELARLDSPPTPVQLARTRECARELLALGPALDPAPWLGNRPCMVDMLPAIGPVPGQAGLWFNFGHGHQGFTLGPVSGRLLAEQLTGQPTVVDPTPYLPQRFR